jgi:hypothetical protein
MTGTLTRNELKVTAVHPMPGFDESHVLGLAALASSDGGQDPVDAVIRSAASQALASDLPKPTKFVPFDPATKMSAATALDPSGATVRSKTARRLDPRLFDALRFTENPGADCLFLRALGLFESVALRSSFTRESP